MRAQIRRLGLLGFVVLPGLLAWPPICMAICNLTWDADKLMQVVRGRPLHQGIRLQDKAQVTVDQISVGQLAAFHLAKERISKEVGSNPRFLVCSDREPNAFAIPTNSGPVVGVTLGMVKFVNGDADQAAYVLGHEWAHHSLKHAEARQGRDMGIAVAGVLLDAMIGARINMRLHVDLGRIGANMVSAKFTRDQEREADDQGLKTMVAAGFNPDGALRVARAFSSAGMGGTGLFFDSHPGWEEREARVRAMIGANPEFQKAFAERGNTPVQVASIQGQPPVATAAPEAAEMEPGQSDFIEAIGALRRRDIAAAAGALRKSADAGYVPALASLGYLYMNGQGVDKDEAEAVRLFRKGAEQGHPLAQANLGFMVQRGRGGLAADPAEAVRLYKLSAEQENPQGQTNLAAMYLSGRGGLAQDQAEAARLYRLAAGRGNAGAKAALGFLYLQGAGGLAKDDLEARKLFQESAAMGNALGQAGLGNFFLQGRGGVPRNPAEGIRLIRLSADQGNSIGQYLLAVLYAAGRSPVEKDEAEAVRLFRLAANQGSAAALRELEKRGIQ